MKVSLEKEEEKLAFQGYFVNRIDSIIYLNLNRSGIELARVVLTPDSVIYVNKLEHEYYAGDYTFLRRVFQEFQRQSAPCGGGRETLLCGTAANETGWDSVADAKH